MLVRFGVSVFALLCAVWLASPSSAQLAGDFCELPVDRFSELSEYDKRNRRVVCAEVGALDQMLVYNRFGSHNPFGQIFALVRDIVPATTPVPIDRLAACKDDIGAHKRPEGLTAGQVRLHDCKRPRPLTLRANVGDVLHVRVHNFLRADAADGRPGYSETFCRAMGYERVTDDHGIRALVSEGSASSGGDYKKVLGNEKLVAAMCAAGAAEKQARLTNEATDWPRTRGISFVIDGLRPLRDPRTGKVDNVCLGMAQLAPGDDPVDCFWHAEREGPYFINSVAAPSGGEGDGGSLTHGLFGSLAVEPQKKGAATTQWYLSQTTRSGFDAAWPPNADTKQRPHDRGAPLDYAAMQKVDGESLPVLNLLKPLGDARYEIVHNALNAIIHADGEQAFREFTVVFHDELKTFYTRNFEELARFPQFEGVRDGFAINYGASGLGAMVLANRKGIGPAADCMECLYEEFFLESWVNGDPALLEAYADDPSNVHHSYLNDPIVFRNYHAGPKETHVFHLHAHQWFGGNDAGRGAYLDSQTVAPRQGFSYRIYHGGLQNYMPGATGQETESNGWWESLGSGNRNRTVGDSIFHCHLYPHFAQGMWELWRVHDVLEDGSRRLPDGQAKPGLSTELLARDSDGKLDQIKARPGSVDADGKYVENAAGTPIPAIVPLPDQPAPLLPTYAGDDGDRVVAKDEALPGYPFFIAGQPGHRAPQPPLDIATATPEGTATDAGLRRHVVQGAAQRELGISVPATDMAVTDGISVEDRLRIEDRLYRTTAKMLALGDFSGHLTKATITPLADAGEPLEQAAMAFHHNGEIAAGRKVAAHDAYGQPSRYDGAAGGYLSRLAATPPETSADMPFAVNGAPPKPGAPFADPCGAPKALAGRDPADPNAATAPMTLLADDPFHVGELDADQPGFLPDPAVTGFRRYAGSAVQVDIVTNKAGWHDPQGRINVLTDHSDRYKNLGPSAKEEPFFFRAYSGECIEFRHTNELPKDLELDDFQVKTPTDTIGQHIHLVKFDVTSADGSGNGWNYEDGTFAADELASRLCAWDATGDSRAKALLTDLENRIRAVANPAPGAELPAGTSFCEWEPVTSHRLWNLKRSEYPFLFQTTVQRWFADPILAIEAETGALGKTSPETAETGMSGETPPEMAETGAPGETPAAMADRTMRTVFTHDHFGPSSIQQHGFYSALVIEPAKKKICKGDVTDNETCMEPPQDPTKVVKGGAEGVGTHKIVTGGPDPELHPDYREFALAVADFALLYDPTDENDDDTAAAAGVMPDGGVIHNTGEGGATLSPKGLATLVCEAEHRNTATGSAPDSLLETRCGSHVTRDQINGVAQVVEDHDTPPALVAADLINHGDKDEVAELRRHFAMVRYRAGYGNGFARPVNGPQRPESISVDHHDPYLVNYRGEPVPLRIGQNSKGRTAFECFKDKGHDIAQQFRRRGPENFSPKPLLDTALNVPGLKVQFDKSLEQMIADAAGRLDCSINAQSPDPRGNLAHAFRSEFFKDEVQPTDAPVAEPPPVDSETLAASESDEASELTRNRGHGDPATPLFETYSDERIQFRLIQGAQEVQHTFTVEGLQWRRQIDQRYPAASVVQANDLPKQTWSQACQQAGRTGIASQHDRWRQGLLTTNDDTKFWDDYSKYAARCDNLESFVAAQEVGISEHFEIPAAPSKFSVQIRQTQANDKGTEQTASLDYMYHFGSQDAIWNGAWGLMRVYENELARDETARIEGADEDCAEAKALGSPKCNVSSALTSLKDLQPGYSRDSSSRNTSPRSIDITTLKNQCPMDAPLIESYAVAMPLPGGQQYASWADGFRDPNGLALIHVPKETVEPYLENGVPAGRVQALRQSALKYFRDEPMVIRANAGDCLRLSIVNALPQVTETSQGCGHPPNGTPGPMADCLGDAPMPRIVKLNVEPSWSEAEGDGPRIRHQTDDIDIRPSARIAITAPLSMMTPGGSAHLPFGVNRTTSVPAGGVQVADYYMGLLRVDWSRIDFLMGNSPVDGPDHSRALQQCQTRKISFAAPNSGPDSEARTILSGKDSEFVVLTTDARKERGQIIRFPINVLGKTYWGYVQKRVRDTRPLQEGVLKNIEQMTVECVNKLLYQKDIDAESSTETPDSQRTPAPVSAIPYAFGAVPLKPVSDLFNQLTHGLFGAIVVEPQGASYAGRQLSADGSGEYRPPRFGVKGSAHGGRGHNTLITLKDAKENEQSFREFTLFYQDGLNLWDSGSKDRWLPISGKSLPIVDNCLVCDDSYDWGEKAVSYLAPAFHRRLRQSQHTDVEAYSDLNAFVFEDDFTSLKDSLSSNSLRLWAHPGEEILIRVVHPGGRARQRAFVTVGNDYDDLYPGFGFPHAALLAPGKSITAALSAPVRSGCYVWSDGPREIEAAGSWGLLDVLTDKGQTSCGFHD